MITRKEFNEMSFDEAWECCCSESDYFKDRGGLKKCAIECIQYGDNKQAITILQALNDYTDTHHWVYSFDCEAPIQINCKEDLEAWIYFEDGPQTYTVELTGSQTVHVDVDSSMSTQDIFNKIVEQIKIKKTAENIYNITNTNTGAKMW